MLAVVRYAGGIFANLAGTYLYQVSAGWTDVLPMFGGGGALPTSLLALPATLNVVALWSALYAVGREGSKRPQAAADFI